MDFSASGDLFEAMIAILLLILFIVQLALVIQERRQLPGLAGIGLMACFTTIMLAGFYLLLAVNFQPLADNIDMRLAIFRPTFAAWLIFLIVKLIVLTAIWRQRGFTDGL